MLEIFTMPVFSRAIIALVVTGMTFPALGTFILNLELIPARFAVMHAALLGAAVGLFFGANPLMPAMAASILTGLIVARISWRAKSSAGGALGMVMTVSLGLAFILFYKGQVNAIAAFNLFWGNILALAVSDLWTVIGTGAAILLFLGIAYKEIQIVLYDRELARAVGTPAVFVYTGVLLITCLGVAVAMRVTGALMVDAVTILPALVARRLGKTFSGMLLWGAAAGLSMNLIGFASSVAFDLPVSPAIIVLGAGLVGAVSGVSWLSRRQKDTKYQQPC